MVSSSETSSKNTPETEAVPLYSDLPDATQEALSSFELLKDNVYIGSLRDSYPAADEVVGCDCVEHVVDGINLACGADDFCINREMKIECVDGQCSCGAHCQNERFQRGDVADVSIFKTEHKGYGMRANCDLPAQTFIVEYKGEVVDSEEYRLRKEQYADEGIKHFYFMKLQDDGMIDATKKADIGRFLNHSCDPNAEIEKWIVNKRYRMGIFAKRDIAKGEEICFNYNVDRYGSEPQKCYCGAKNCIGVLGGRTQTQMILRPAARDALGIHASDEKKWIKEQKKLGVKVDTDKPEDHLDELVNSLELTRLKPSEVRKVSSYFLQPESKRVVIERTLERFEPNDQDYPDILYAFNRLHGLQALSLAIKKILTDDKLTAQDKQALSKIVHILDTWPSLTTKTTVHNCNLEQQLADIADRVGTKDVKSSVDRILDDWKDLPIIYRIPKRLDNGTSSGSPVTLDDRRSKSASVAAPSPVKSDLPPGWQSTVDPKTNVAYYYNREKNITQWEKPEWPQSEEVNQVADVVAAAAAVANALPSGPALQSGPAQPSEDSNGSPAPDTWSSEKRVKKEFDHERHDQHDRELERLRKEREKAELDAIKEEEQKSNTLASIIDQASKEAAEAESKREKEKNARKRRHDAKKRSRSKSAKPSHTRVEKDWMAFFATVVPNMLKKYESKIGHDNVKQCAREITHVLAQKELERHNGAEPPTKVSDDRKKKIHLFVKKFMDKFVAKFEEKKRKHRANGEHESKRQKT